MQILFLYSQANRMTAFRKTAETFQEGDQTLAQCYFTSPEVFVRERERIFWTQWVCLGHQSQIPNPRDFFLQEIAGESLITVRGQDEQVRAFYNVCRHRGTRLCEEKSGSLHQTIQCPYHAWTYALDGRLLGAPHMDDVAGFDKTAYSLYSVNLATWEGFIFVNLSERAAIPHEKMFAPLAGKFTHWNLPKLRSARRIEYDVSANWKLIFQNYSECYHCPLVHPALSKLTPYDSAENDLCEGPFLGGFMAINKGSMTTSGNTCALPVGDIKAEDHRRVFYYSIFPNMLLSMHPDYVMVHLIRPIAPGRVTILCDWLFHPDAFAQPHFNPEDAIEFWDITNRQDWHVCELSHAGISSRAYRPGPYSPRETICAAWDREYLRAMGEA
jgi:Rieske 2Fe-2S family protein